MNINENDIALWRSFNQQLKTTMKYGPDSMDVLEEIDCKVTIKTNVLDQINIPVKAVVAKPSIIKERILDFGVTQVGSHKKASIELHNPFNETLYLSLFLGRNTEYINNELEKMGGVKH